MLLSGGGCKIESCRAHAELGVEDLATRWRFVCRSGERIQVSDLAVGGNYDASYYSVVLSAHYYHRMASVVL